MAHGLWPVYRPVDPLGPATMSTSTLPVLLLFDGSTHRVLLPPELAYKDRPDREPANNQWLLFELSINELYL